MTFFNINGWNVPIVNGGMTESSSPYGNSGKSFTNKQLIRRRMVPRSWTGKMLFQTPSVADTVEGLLMGRGHHFSFDRDFWSDSGVAPTSLSNKSIVEGGGLQRFGTGHADFTADMSFDVGFPTGKWTVIVWADLTGTGDWHHYAETATGDTYEDGEAAAVTPFVSVVDGVLTISEADFPVNTAIIKGMDDLVLLPFNVDSSFISGLYAWQTDNGVVMQCPFDYPGDFVDRVNYIAGAPAGPGPVVAGDQTRKTGSGSLLSTFVIDQVEFTVNPGDPTELDTDTSTTVSFWIRPEFQSLIIGSNMLFDHFDSGASVGWQIDFVSDQARARFSNGVAQLNVTDPDSSDVDEWVHLTAVYEVSGASTSLKFYKNGSLVSTASLSLNSTTGTANIFLGDSAALSGFTGNMDDLRYYKSALTPAQIYDVYNEGVYGYDYIPPQGRAFSKLPRLLVSGDCIGSQHPKQVIGKVNSESYVQHGGTYSPNDRSIEMLLQEVSPLREEGIPSPDGNFILSPEFIIDSSTPIQRQSCSGGYQYEDGSTGTLTPPTLAYDSDDSFGFCLDFNGATDGILLPSDISGGSNIGLDLGGHNSVTVAAWFNVNATGSQYDILSLPVDTGLIRLMFRIQNTDVVAFGGRSTSAVLPFSDATSTATVVASKWYFVAGVIYPMSTTPDGLIQLYGNIGAGTSEPTLSLLAENTTADFATTEFSAETDTSLTPDQNHIGINFNGTTAPFNGKIKSVMMWKRALEMDEIMTVFRKGYDQRIFR